MRAFRDRERIELDFLLDPEGTSFAAYGILNERHDKTVPHPTVVVVDDERVARYVVTDEDYKVRPPAAEVVDVVRRLASSAGD